MQGDVKNFEFSNLLLDLLLLMVGGYEGSDRGSEEISYLLVRLPSRL